MTSEEHTPRILKVYTEGFQENSGVSPGVSMPLVLYQMLFNSLRSNSHTVYLGWI